MNGVDLYDVSDFNVVLHYNIDALGWEEKDFVWFSNDLVDSLSYWRVELTHGNEILNGDSVSFYITVSDYTSHVFTDDNSGDYYEFEIEGIAQPVRVTFSLNMGGYVADSIAVFGNESPLSWTDGLTLTDENGDKTFLCSAVFPETSNDTIQYKYQAKINNEWIWEDFSGNREFVIDDSDSLQVLSTVNWSNEEFNEISGVNFISEINSDFTNFIDRDTLDAGSSVFIEAKVEGKDETGNSAFSVVLHYTVNDSSYTKDFYWYKDDSEANYSYWRVVLENGTEINDSELCTFYVTAENYTQVTYTDDNNAMNYQVYVSNFGLQRDVTVRFLLKTGNFEADSLSLQGDISPLDWTSTAYLTDNGEKLFSTDVLFPQGSSYNLAYKYRRYVTNESRWIWESIDNRNLTIDDDSSLFILDTLSWNNAEINEISEVAFLDSVSSVYTNFKDGDVLETGSSLLIEVEINGERKNALVTSRPGQKGEVQAKIVSGKIETEKKKSAKKMKTQKKPPATKKMAKNVHFFAATVFEMSITQEPLVRLR